MDIDLTKLSQEVERRVSEAYENGRAYERRIIATEIKDLLGVDIGLETEATEVSAEGWPDAAPMFSNANALHSLDEVETFPPSTDLPKSQWTRQYLQMIEYGDGLKVADIEDGIAEYRDGISQSTIYAQLNKLVAGGVLVKNDGVVSRPNGAA